MPELTPSPLAAICTQLRTHTLPRWQELPDLELYMDQILSLIARYLGPYPGYDEKGLTAAMVNNYVKMGALPPPVKKRYTRSHVARLLVICLLKPCLPIAAIRDLIDDAQIRLPEEAFYDRFCVLFETACSTAADAHDPVAGGEPADALLCAALRGQAEQSLALKLYSVLFPDT